MVGTDKIIINVPKSEYKVYSDSPLIERINGNRYSDVGNDYLFTAGNKSYYGGKAYYNIEDIGVTGEVKGAILGINVQPQKYNNYLTLTFNPSKYLENNTENLKTASFNDLDTVINQVQEKVSGAGIEIGDINKARLKRIDTACDVHTDRDCTEYFSIFRCMPEVSRYENRDYPGSYILQNKSREHIVYNKSKQLINAKGISPEVLPRGFIDRTLRVESRVLNNKTLKIMLNGRDTLGELRQGDIQQILIQEQWNQLKRCFFNEKVYENLVKSFDGMFEEVHTNLMKNKRTKISNIELEAMAYKIKGHTLQEFVQKIMEISNQNLSKQATYNKRYRIKKKVEYIFNGKGEQANMELYQELYKKVEQAYQEIA